MEEVCKTPDPSLQGASRSSSVAFQGGRNVAIVSSMSLSSSLSDTCIVVVDNRDDRQQRCCPAKERAVELAETNHWDDGKGKREKKEHGSGSIGAGNNDNTPSFAA